MDGYMQWVLAGLSAVLLLACFGYRVFKQAADAKRRVRRAAAAAAAQAEAQRANAEAARQQAERTAAALAAARVEASRFAQAEAARVEAAKAARAEAARKEAARLASEQAARAVAAKAAADESARVEAERRAAAEAARMEAARAAAQEAAAREAAAQEAARAETARAAAVARLQAARLAADQAVLAEAARLAAEQALKATRAATPKPPRVAKTPDQMLVMIADDSKIVRIKTGRLLAQHHYRVSYATDGLDAAQQMQTSIPDVVITDVEMPGMDGFELTRHVRQNPMTARIPIIMITAADDRHREDADRAGVNVLLGKPYADDELIAQIQRATKRDEAQAHTRY
jgi:CheY-like chemotaxis protein